MSSPLLIVVWSGRGSKRSREKGASQHASLSQAEGIRGGIGPAAASISSLVSPSSQVVGVLDLPLDLQLVLSIPAPSLG